MGMINGVELHTVPAADLVDPSVFARVSKMDFDWNVTWSH